MVSKLPAQTPEREKPKRVEVRPEDVRLGQRAPHRPDSLTRVVVAFLGIAAVITVCGLVTLAILALLTSWLQPGL